MNVGTAKVAGEKRKAKAGVNTRSSPRKTPQDAMYTTHPDPAANIWAPPQIHIGNLGPHPISSIDDAVRGHLVCKMGVPIIVKDVTTEGTEYAVLTAPNRSMKILCAACFVPGCKLNDDRRCRKISSFVQHMQPDRQEKRSCESKIENNSDKLSCVHDRNKEKGISDSNFLPDTDEPEVNIGKVESIALVQELKRRGDLGDLLNYIDTDTIAVKASELGIKLLLDARPIDLKHELRRLNDPYRPGIEAYYSGDKVPGIANFIDPMEPDEGNETYKDNVPRKTQRKNKTTSAKAAARKTPSFTTRSSVRKTRDKRPGK
jgi:hypothetical protein